MKETQHIGALSVIAAGVLWGGMGVFARFFQSVGLTSIQIGALRIVTAAISMILILLVFNRKLFKIKLKDCWCFVGTGIISLVTFTSCYFRTIKLTSLSVAAVLLYTAPIIVMLLSVILFKEKLTFKKVIVCIFVFVGCIFVTGLFGSSSPAPASGIFTGMISAVGYALYSIFSRYAINKGYRPLTIAAYTFIFASVGIIPFANLPHIINTVSSAPQNIAMAVGIGVISATAPYLLYTIGLTKVESGKASIMASIEPVVATVLGVTIFHETLTVNGIIGIITVLVSICLLNLSIPVKKSQITHEQIPEEEIL